MVGRIGSRTRNIGRIVPSQAEREEEIEEQKREGGHGAQQPLSNRHENPPVRRRPCPSDSGRPFPAAPGATDRFIVFGTGPRQALGPPARQARISGRAYSFCRLGKIDGSPSTSSSSVGSVIWRLPDMSR